MSNLSVGCIPTELVSLGFIWEELGRGKIRKLEIQKLRERLVQICHKKYQISKNVASD